jgi:sRNA-binding protein
MQQLVELRPKSNSTLRLPNKNKKPRELSPDEKRSRDIRLFRKWLAREYPNCFCAPGTKWQRQPLKIGIREDIITTFVGSNGKRNAFAFHLSLALHDYTRGPRYLRSLTAGAIRVDLDGNPAGVVTEEAAAIAVERLAVIASLKKEAV